MQQKDTIEIPSDELMAKEAIVPPLLDLVLNPECYDTLFLQHKWLDVGCLKLILAKALGYATIVGSFGLKVPQILAVLESKDVEALVPLSMYSEVPMYLSYVIYGLRQGNPFSSYGENLVIAIQNAILVGLLWTFKKDRPSFGHMVGVIALFVAFVAGSYQLPDDWQFILPFGNFLLLLSSRLPQIYSNFVHKDTGSLSAVTLFMMFAGGLARIFTTLQEAPDSAILIVNYVCGAVASGTLLLQVFLYSKGGKKKAE